MGDSEKTSLLPTEPASAAPVEGPLRTRMALATGAEKRLALDLSVVAGNAYGVAGDLGREHFLFDIRAGGGPVSRVRLPLNLSLALDRSGAMEGEILDYARRACAYIVDLLEPNDLISIVIFDGSGAEVVVPARRVANKLQIKEAISRITVGSESNLYEGLLAACSQINSVKTIHTLNRVLLLTGAAPTVGVSESSAIFSQVAEQKGRGIGITTLGVGPEYHEELLAGIARRSGGSYYYIARPELIPEIFRLELDTLMRVTARNLHLRLVLARGVSVRQVPGQMPVFGQRSAEVTLIDVEREMGLSSLWELEMTPRAAGIYRLAVAELFYDDALTGKQEKLTADVIWEFTADRRRIGTGMDPRLQGEIEVAHAARALDMMLLGLKTQQVDLKTQQVNREQVMQKLNRTKTLMLDHGKLAQAQQITQAMRDIQGGGAVEKTLVGTIYTLDQGKTR